MILVYIYIYIHTHIIMHQNIFHFLFYSKDYDLTLLLLLLLLLLLVERFSHQRELIVFHWSWVTASLLKSLGLFSVFLPISIMQSFLWSPLVHQLPSPPGIIVTFMFHSSFKSLARSRYLSFFSHSFSFILWPVGTTKSTILQVLFFCCCCWLLLGLVFCPRFGDSSVCRSPIGVYMCHFLGQMLGCPYTICSYGQI